MHLHQWACLLLVAPAISGCADRDATDRLPESREAQATRLLDGGTAAIGVSAGPTTVFPPLAAAALDFELGSALYPGLNVAVWRNGRATFPEGHPLGLARSWTVDGAEVTYMLDTDRRWSDGTPVTADDVVFTYSLLSDPDEPLPLSGVVSRLDSVMAVNDSTVRFFFEAPYPAMVFDTGIGILPAHAYQNLGLDGLRAVQASGDPLVVSGPFTLEEWRPAESLTLARNPAGVPRARLDRVVFRVLPDETVRRAALRAGELDMARLDSFGGLEGLTADGIRLERIPQRGYDFVAWNPAAHPAFADQRVRRALSLAIDRDAIIAATDMTGFAEGAYGPYGSLFSDLAPTPEGDVWFDVWEAGRLLEDAGWTDTDGDGIRDYGGAALSFRLETSAGNDRRDRAVQLIRSQLAAVGVDAVIGVQEFSSLFARARARDYEAVLLGWQVGLDPDISFFWADPDSPVNLVGFRDSVVSALMDRALAAPSADDARPYWRDAADRIAAEYPYAFLWFFDQLVAVGPDLGGVEVGVTGFAQNLHEWGRIAPRN